MKILHIVPTYFPAIRYGGPIYSVHGLCRALVGLGHEVHVFTTNVDGASDSDVEFEKPVDLDGVKVWYFPSRRLRRLYYSPPMMKMLQEKAAEFDLLHLHSVFLWPTWAAARVARKAGVPYVLSPRGMLVRELVRRKSRFLKTCWIQLIERKNLEQAAAAHLTSEREAEDLAGFSFQLPVVFVIANGVELPQEWFGDALSDDVRGVIQPKGYVLYFGRINWKKGLDRLLRAWKEVPDQRLVIAGNDEENYLARLQEIAENEAVQKKVVFLTRSISGADKEALFACAGLFVLPSYSENFGITVLEAMIRGVPVLVTREVGAAEVVREVQGGLVIDGQPESLANAIGKQLLSPEHRKDEGRRVQNLVMERYGWPAVARQMEIEYQHVVSGIDSGRSV